MFGRGVVATAELIQEASVAVAETVSTATISTAELVQEGLVAVGNVTVLSRRRPVPRRIVQQELIYEVPTFTIHFNVILPSFPSPGPGGNSGPTRDDVMAIISITVSIGCLIPSPLTPAFQVAAFAISGYTLTKKTAKMVQRVLDGENIIKPNVHNVVEWLELLSCAGGFASTSVSKIIVPSLRNGETREVLVFLADFLKIGGMHCKTASIVAKSMSAQYEKKLQSMTDLQKMLEMAATMIHFMKLAKEFGLWDDNA